jgi:hypothetical protein
MISTTKRYTVGLSLLKLIVLQRINSDLFLVRLTNQELLRTLRDFYLLAVGKKITLETFNLKNRVGRPRKSQLNRMLIME